MLTDVDLPAPGLLWTRWATLAAALTGIGYADVWFTDEQGAHHEHDGGWARLALLDGARAVLYGHDRDHSPTAPIDLLAGAPDWLPWAGVSPRDELGFVAWHGEGRWSRARYRDDLGDGLTQITGAVLSTENTLAELSDVVTEWGRHDLRTPAERDQVRAAGEQLLAAAGRGEVTGPAFERLLGRLTEPALDLKAALSAAARGGITAGTRPPRIAPGDRPAMRRVRRLSHDEHDRLVWSAMHEAAELPRPAPPATAELATLVAWLRGRSPSGDGRCTLLAYADATSMSTRPAASPTLTDLVRSLRRAESDPRSGRWLFLRMETTSAGFEVQRRYDSWPPWWPADAAGPWRTNLQEEMDRRTPAWRPPWTTLLDPEG